MSVNGKGACALRASSYPRIMRNWPAVIFQLTSLDLEPQLFHSAMLLTNSSLAAYSFLETRKNQIESKR